LTQCDLVSISDLLSVTKTTGVDNRGGQCAGNVMGL
jgi:hypothetical protein